MPRVIRLTVREPRTPAFGTALLESLGPDKPKPKRKLAPGRYKKTLEASCAECLDIAKNGPDKAEPRHLVALYATSHEGVYGTFPEELRQAKNFAGACSAARKLVDDVFDGSTVSAIDFLRWVWQEERNEWPRRRAKGGKVFLVGWRYQFAERDLVTRYRVATRARAR